MSLLHNIGLSGLVAGQTGLNSTAQNVSNTLTEWYSRREPVLEPRQVQSGGSLLMAAGVSVEQVRRITNDFVNTRVWYTSGQYEQARITNSYMRQLDAILGDEHTSYAQPLSQLQRSLQQATVTPESIAVRQQVLGDAHLAAMQLNTLQERLIAFHEQVNEQTKSLIAEINQLASNVARVNDSISDATVEKTDAGDLLDNRNRLINRLTELAGVTVQKADKGMVNVFLAGGERLVSGNKPAILSVHRGEPDPLLSQIRINDDPNPLTTEKFGGMLGGITRFQEQTLLREQNTLGFQAILLASGTNRILGEGFDLAGNKGKMLFQDINDSSILSGRVLAEINAGKADLTLKFQEDSSENYVLSDYRITFFDPTAPNVENCEVTRLNDGVTKRYSFSENSPLQLDGLKLTVSGAPKAGDTFTLVPWRHEAGHIKTVLQDPQALGFSGGSQSQVGTGKPIVVESNGPGDNSNLQNLLDYMEGKGLANSLAVYYDREVSRVATEARQAASREQAEKTLQASALAERNNLSGVNLDEEAANLIRLQQYYQANVRVISTGTQLIDELLAMV